MDSFLGRHYIILLGNSTVLKAVALLAVAAHTVTLIFIQKVNFPSKENHGPYRVTETREFMCADRCNQCTIKCGLLLSIVHRLHKFTSVGPFPS